MSQQNFKNHLQFSPVFHFVTVPICLICVGMSVQNLTRECNLISVLLLLMCIVLLLGLALMRLFSLKAQDRAIRAEENLRHFALTGKLLNKNLTMGQIVALRFADDAEFLELAAKASKDNMSSKQIKQSIKNWKADHYRV